MSEFWRTLSCRRTATLFGVMLLSGAWAATATAQPASDAKSPEATLEDRAPTVSAGLNIVTVAGSFGYMSSDETESAQMNWALAYSRVFAGGLAVGAGITTHTDWTDYSDTETWGEISGGPRWFLPVGESRVHPYVGARLGIGFGKDDNPTSFGGGFGLMILMGSRSKGAGVVGEMSYAAEKYDNRTDHQVMVALGFTLYLR